MKVALISDIHGNYCALEAVLADLCKDKIDQAICLGDTISSGPQPRQVLDRLKTEGMTLVLGNADQRLLHPISVTEADDHVRMLLEIESWIRQVIPADELSLLGNAKQRVHVKLSERLSLLCCHGSPRSIDERLLTELSDHQLDQILSGEEFDLLAVGHTHVPMLRNHRNRLLLNPGTVGSPVGKGPITHYAVLSIEEEKTAFSLRTIRYDVNPALKQAQRSGMPHADWWINRWFDEK